MKSFLTFLSVLFVSFALVAPQAAEAKRFGGGKSFGQQKQITQQKKQAAQQQRQAAQQARDARVANSGASKWLGPLAGLAAGGFLAWMLFGDGFEGLQFMDILLFGLLAFGLFMIFRTMMARKQAVQPAHNPYQQQPEQAAQHYYAPADNQGTSNQATTRSGSSSFSDLVIGENLSENAQHQVAAPAWFDATRFAEDAKQHFVAVQKAWDAADASEIESYCTPELFAEISQMMAGMQAGENFTQVDDLHSEIVDQSIDGEYFIASVKFSGFIQEGQNEDAHSFNEIWHIRRLAAGEGNWQIAGIQQQN